MVDATSKHLEIKEEKSLKKKIGERGRGSGEGGVKSENEVWFSSSFILEYNLEDIGWKPIAQGHIKAPTILFVLQSEI